MVADTVPHLSKHGEVDEVVVVLAVFRLVRLRIRGARRVESSRSPPLCGQRAGARQDGRRRGRAGRPVGGREVRAGPRAEGGVAGVDANRGRCRGWSA